MQPKFATTSGTARSVYDRLPKHWDQPMQILAMKYARICIISTYFAPMHKHKFNNDNTEISRSSAV